MRAPRLLSLFGLVTVIAVPWAAAAVGACGSDGADGSGASGSGAASGTGGHNTTGTGGSGGVIPPGSTCPTPKDPVDVSTPTATVGDGSAASCDEAALDTALAGGGIITFDCGAAPITLTVTSQKQITADTVIDGGGLVTLSGGGTTRILHVASAWDQVSPHLTVQRLAFTNGFTTDVPNTSDTTQGGAAIFREGGTLDVIDCQFTNNHGAASGQDVSGGAVTSQGVGDTVIVGSSFANNSCSNGGAVGNLGNGLTVVNSTFSGNAATGTDGNPGNGGDGGAIVFDGAGTELTICGSTFAHNSAGAQGGAVFRVAYTDEPTVIDRSIFDQNAADQNVGLAGALYLEFTTIVMSATTLSNNRAHYGGGLWIGHAAVAQIENVTFSGNTADQGGGLWVAGQVTGEIKNATFADNDVNPGGYAPTSFGGDANLHFANTLIVGGGCEDNPLGSSGTNLQFPASTGSSCYPNALDADPLLGPLADNGGPTQTRLPASGSPAIGQGANCPATDQRGEPRPAACTLGAVEPP